jgi:hypothetical protein
MSTYLGLLLATVGALTIPPLLTGTVDKMAAGTGNFEVGPGDRDQGAIPLRVAEGGGTLEGDCGTRLQSCQVQNHFGGDSHVLNDNGRARALVLDGRSCISERAACTGVKAAGSSRDERTSAEKEGGKRKGNHDVGSL